jgi:hypothetical protein
MIISNFQMKFRLELKLLIFKISVLYFHNIIIDFHEGYKLDLINYQVCLFDLYFIKPINSRDQKCLP